MKSKDVYFINGPLSGFNINSSAKDISEYPVSSDIGQQTFNIDFPADEVRLNFSNVAKTYPFKLVTYRDIHELIENKIGINFTFHAHLRIGNCSPLVPLPSGVPAI